MIKCPYCGTYFEHDGKEEYQVCPKCDEKLICAMPTEEYIRSHTRYLMEDCLNMQ